MVDGNFHFHACFKYKRILLDTNLSGVQSSFTSGDIHASDCHQGDKLDNDLP